MQLRHVKKICQNDTVAVTGKQPLIPSCLVPFPYMGLISVKIIAGMHFKEINISPQTPLREIQSCGITKNDSFPVMQALYLHAVVLSRKS